jgi:RimJ/RimL family protein N-acetyltransferase
MIIKTDRLILRPLTFADAETAFYGWTGDAEVARHVNEVFKKTIPLRGSISGLGAVSGERLDHAGHEGYLMIKLL